MGHGDADISESQFIPTLIGLRAFDLVSSPVWWEAATNNGGLRGRSQGTLGSTRSDPTLSWLHSLHHHF